jgi:nicotinamidase-related amidase
MEIARFISGVGGVIQSMSALMFDRDRAALVVIDLQRGIALDPELKPHSSQEAIANAVRLLDAFRQRRLPVFLVRIELSKDIALNPESDLPPLDPLDSPPGFAEFVPELKPASSDIIITKRQWAAFHGTELELHLRRRGVTTIVLCGVATNFGVEGTARVAYENGYEQVFPEDAMTASSEEEHHASLNILRRLGRVRATEEIVQALG